MSEDKSWAVVETRPNCEGMAERSLLRLGYEPWVPRYRKLLRGVRVLLDGSRVRSRGDDLVERPYLPGYLFLLLEAGEDAMTADMDHGAGKPAGIKRVLRRPLDATGRARPRFVRASIVEGVRLAASMCDETPKPVRQDLRNLLKSGAPVMVRHPLGFVATLLSLDGRGRARYIAQLFGGDVPGEIEDAGELEVVA